MFERGHERDRNVATNVAETWPTKWLIGHVVTWPACSAMLWPCSGHIEHDRNVATNVARTWPHCDERGQKRGQQHGRGQLTNVAHSRRTWPGTWPATLAILRATFEVFSTFSIFSHFFVFQCRYQSQTLFVKVCTLKIQISFEKNIFSPKFSKHEMAKSESENPISELNWLT